MRNLILLFALILSHNVYAETRDILTLGSDGHEVVWFIQKKIKSTDIYLIGYQSPQKKHLEKVVPRQAYFEGLKELQDLKKSLSKKRDLAANPFCMEQASTQHNDKKELLCLDFQDKKTKRKLIHWVAKQANLLFQ